MFVLLLKVRGKKIIVFVSFFSLLVSFSGFNLAEILRRTQKLIKISCKCSIHPTKRRTVFSINEESLQGVSCLEKIYEFQGVLWLLLVSEIYCVLYVI